MRSSHFNLVVINPRDEERVSEKSRQGCMIFPINITFMIFYAKMNQYTSINRIGLAGSVTSVIILCLSGLWYIGVFKKIKFEEGKVGPVKFVHRKHSGPYKNSGIHFGEILSILEDQDLSDCKTAGIYYDDPKTTSNPRYACGFLVEIAQKDRFEDAKESFLREFEEIEIKETRTKMSSFPVRAGILSYALSSMKTYNTFEKKGHQMKCGSIEVYDGEEIETHFPQENCEEFLPS